MNPNNYIGKSGRIAAMLLKQIPKLQAKDCPIMQRRYLFTGNPGLGKSAIAVDLGRALCTHALGIEQVNGRSCSVELIREYQFHGQFWPMFGMRVQIIDEVDDSSPADEIAAWLRVKFPAMDAVTAGDIARQSRGNVRAAEMTALSCEAWEGAVAV